MCETAQHVKKFVETVEVVRNDTIAPAIFLLQFKAPKLAQSLKPGQFVHLMIDQTLTLRRPLSIAHVRGDIVSILYAVVGKGTQLLSEKRTGDTTMNALGPCGNAWPLPDEDEASLLVGGGLGVPPLGMLAHKLMAMGRDFHFIQGARSAELVIARDFHDDAFRDIEYATDDGTLGTHGLITEPLRRALESGKYRNVYVCGPEIMERFVVAECAKFDVNVYVSLERLMACGIGACLSCNIMTKQGPKKVCVDGPIFNAVHLEFDDLARSAFH